MAKVPGDASVDMKTYGYTMIDQDLGRSPGTKPEEKHHSERQRAMEEIEADFVRASALLLAQRD